MTTDDSQSMRLPDDLHEVAAAIDTLARRHRESATNLEERLFSATRDALAQRGVAVQPAARAVDGRSSRAVQTPGMFALLRFTPMRLAAVVAICGSALAVWVASSTGPASGPAPMAAAGGQQEADYMVALAWLDDGWASLGEHIDVLKLETEAVSGSLSWDWAQAMPVEGAM
jgi:hypothetical protein